jgi:hypothetical protein
MRLTTLLIFIALLSVSCGPGRDSSGNFEVFRVNGKFAVRDAVSGRRVGLFARADLAFQKAIELLDPKGGMVNVLSGEYPLESHVHLKDGIKLQGSGPATVLQISPSNETGTAIVLDGTDAAEVSALKIITLNGTGPGVGILLNHCGSCTISDILCAGDMVHGIALRRNSFLCEIRDCKVMGARGSGIMLDSLDRGGRGGDWVPNLVSNCIINSCGEGIECHRSIVANIVACEVYQSSGPAYHIRNTSNSILISGCRSYQIRSDAVVVENSHEINITGNTFCWHEKRGIVLDHVRWGTITGNNLIDNGSINIWPAGDVPPDDSGRRPFAIEKPDTLNPPNVPGMVLINSTKGLTVLSNSIFNWPVCPPMDWGIIEDETCSYNIITNNNVNFCLHGAVSSSGKNSIANNNLVYEEKSHQGDPGNALQSFDLSLMREHINKITATD